MSGQELNSDSLYAMVEGNFLPSRYTNLDPQVFHKAEYQTETSMTINTTGLHSFTIIIKLEDAAGQPVNFSNQYYQIWVSNDAYDNPPFDEFDYYHTHIVDPRAGWTHLRDVSCGTGSSVDNSFSRENSGTYGCCVDFKYVRIIVPAIMGYKTKIYGGAR
jgi:hypothetical protein